jgi:radical SAM-linked protein
MAKRQRVPPRAADHVPAVQKLRIRYAKRGRLRFTSHRDFQRALERALRRAEIPMAFSAGFSPHPRISYANAAPTGVASEAEYVEIGVVRTCDPEQVRESLDAALPNGLDIVDVVEATTSDFAARLEASEWRMEMPQVSLDELAAAWAHVESADSCVIERVTKSGRKEIDIRPAILASSLSSSESATSTPPLRSGGAEGSCAILRLVVRQVTPTVRPDDILAALRSVAGFTPPVPPLVTREAQGPLATEGDRVTDPLAADRGKPVD